MAEKIKLPRTDTLNFVPNTPPQASAIRGATANYMYDESQRPVGPATQAPRPALRDFVPNTPQASAIRDATANYMYNESQRPIGPDFKAPPANQANRPDLQPKRMPMAIPPDAPAAANNSGLPDGVSVVKITPTRGYDTAIKRPTAAAPADDDFNPTKELYSRAQALLEQGQDEGDGGYRDRLRAAMLRRQGTRLLDAARGFHAEAGLNSRAGRGDNAALQRTQMTEEGANLRADRQNESELERTMATGRNQLANTKLSNELYSAGRIKEQRALAMLPAAMSDNRYKDAQTRKTNLEAESVVREQHLMDTIQSSAPGSPPFVSAARQLVAMRGGVDQAQKALNEYQIKVATDPTVPVLPGQREAVAAGLYRDAGSAGYAEGGAISRYADGGTVAAPAGQAALGSPDITPQINLVNDYRAYASAAARLGATPVSFDQFSAMKASSVQPMAGYADGGMVEEPSLLGFAKYALRGGRLPNEVDQQPQQQQQAQPQGVPPNNPFAVTSGISAIQNHKRQLEESLNYADGGAINVSGRQVVGAGDGKSDSIPAVIDGTKPAALSTGEFVFPVEAVLHFGMDKLNKMVEAARASSSK